MKGFDLVPLRQSTGGKLMFENRINITNRRYLQNTNVSFDVTGYDITLYNIAFGNPER